MAPFKTLKPFKIKKMKKINLVFAALVFFLVNCSEESINKSGEADPQVSITGSWKLSSVVNLSDENKYLNSILELSANNKYVLTDNTGAKIISSSFERSSSDITFNNGLFEDYIVTMKVSRLTNTELWLTEHYTFDNKDAYIEYHWTKN